MAILFTACSTVIWYGSVGWAVPPNATGDEENYRVGTAHPTSSGLPNAVSVLINL